MEWHEENPIWHCLVPPLEVDHKAKTQQEGERLTCEW